MADKKISELDELTTPSSTDVLPISHGEDTYKVKVQNLVPPVSSSLEDLEDVEITTPSDGDALVYDEESEKWVNGQGGGKQTALTQAEYDALVEAGTVDPTMEYFITDGIPASVIPWTELTATLTAGQTSLVFSNAKITLNSTIDIYVDDSFYGVNPTAVTLAIGSVTLTFNEQASDLPVKVRIS